MDRKAWSALEPELRKVLIKPQIYEKDGIVTVIIEKENMSERMVKVLEVIAKKNELYWADGKKHFIIY